jgi:hypothetical protein
VQRERGDGERVRLRLATAAAEREQTEVLREAGLARGQRLRPHHAL